MPLETGQLHGSHWQGNIGQFHISNLSNVTEKDGIIKVTDVGFVSDIVIPTITLPIDAFTFPLLTE